MPPRKQHTPNSNTPLFIVNSSAKIDPASRKQIRSHVMRGKNRKRVDLSTKPSFRSWINDCQVSDYLPLPQSIPPRVGNDLSHIAFIIPLKPYMQDLMFQWFTVIKQAVYPVETCVQPDSHQWVEYLSYDQAYLHSVLFSTHAFFDWSRSAKIGDVTMHHLNTCIVSLQQNLLNACLAVSDSTITTVTTLAMMADLFGDYEDERKHIEGLFKIVEVRGGIRALQYNPQLQSKVLRGDLGLALSTGSKPLFFSEGFSWEPYLYSQTHSVSPNKSNSSTPTSDIMMPYITDPRLLNIYLDLREFSRAANLAIQIGTKIGAAEYLETLVSVQYRLLALQHECGDPPVSTEDGKLLRVGMLAFTTTTFLHVKGLPFKFPHLQDQVRECCQGLDTQKHSKKLELWFLFVAYISALGKNGTEEDERMLVEKGREIATGMKAQWKGKIGWNEVRKVLIEVMWIDWVHSEYGRVFLDKLAVC
ncbi:hypothetical protein B0T21DRAFT_345677 [Apiosordaria backusii]|uniref:Uncharacterized protein n=1 Tax=Apiosordaria backusii TaxID=314023 RepID=A0AA40K0W2_9PEZI|nr:hypothetical protein B0T21DRAFT_345677 [Apiosordaria backusii]